MDGLGVGKVLGFAGVAASPFSDFAADVTDAAPRRGTGLGIGRGHVPGSDGPEPQPRMSMSPGTGTRGSDPEVAKLPQIRRSSGPATSAVVP